MNNRTRFSATMHYQARDWTPITDFGFWTETLPIWHKQGLPKSVQFKGDKTSHMKFLAWTMAWTPLRAPPTFKSGCHPIFAPSFYWRIATITGSSSRKMG